MRTSEQTEKLCPAMAKAYTKLQDPETNSVNSHFKNKYAKLSAGTVIVRPTLAAEGLFYTQGASKTEALGLVLVTRITHVSGQWIETDYPMAANNDPQKQASANTYARRHSLFSALGLAPDEDDDGNRAAKTQDKEDAEAAFQKGAQAGREWAVREYLAKGSKDFSGGSFAAALKKAEADPSMTLQNVKLWRIWRGGAKPSRMKEERVSALIPYLTSSEGRASWDAFSKAMGGTVVAPKKKAAAKKKAPPTTAVKEAPHWTPEVEKRFSKRLRELEFTTEAVAGWRKSQGLPHPSTLNTGALKDLLEWVATSAGATVIMEWEEAQTGGDS